MVKIPSCQALSEFFTITMVTPLKIKLDIWNRSPDAVRACIMADKFGNTRALGGSRSRRYGALKVSIFCPFIDMFLLAQPLHTDKQ